MTTRRHVRNGVDCGPWVCTHLDLCPQQGCLLLGDFWVTSPFKFSSPFLPVFSKLSSWVPAHSEIKRSKTQHDLSLCALLPQSKNHYNFACRTGAQWIFVHRIALGCPNEGGTDIPVVCQTYGLLLTNRAHLLPSPATRSIQPSNADICPGVTGCILEIRHLRDIRRGGRT
jgi:hypothetical protein